MKFNVATGKSRKDLKWKNKQFTWMEFLTLIRDTHRTVEEVDEYIGFKKERQDEIKDIGGFVGGHLAGGRRLVHSVTSRSMMTLDADEATPDFWDKFCLAYGCTAAIYSTHKHTPAAPRFRLIIPLSREIFPDEYYAIARRIAGDIGIDMFDHTGYQPHRLMYWPSTPKNGVYVFESQEGELLDPDQVLRTYRDWTDVSEWPQGTKERKSLKNEAKKQGEPSEKPGLIGAFNRAYTISAAIDKFLPDVYEKAAVKDRYTFKHGSTAAGVIVYGDQFLYSHHSTDPVSSTLCNAFDLVRIHKFILKDSDDEDIPINKRPSYIAMCDLASEDSVVKKQVGEARIKAFADVHLEGEDVGEEADQMKWLEEMDMDRKSNYLVTLNNLSLILEHDPVFKGNIKFDDFECVGIFNRDVPWRKVAGKNSITDNDLANIENYIEKVYKIPGGTKLLKGLSIVFERFRFHPIVDYLKGLKWDGKNRVNTLLIDFLGAEDCPYTIAVTRKTLLAAVARVMHPGIKFDNVLTLVGKEGQGKSALWDKLGGTWFSDTFNMHMLQSKEAYEQIQGVWIIEIGELAGMAKAEIERVKGFLSARKDRYRSPYGRTTDLRLRQCIFVASTNVGDFLKSQTGNRRFWPVATFTGKPQLSVHDITQEDVDQIWAEVYYLYMKKEKIYLDQEIEQIAFEVQEEFTEENPWVTTFRNYLSTPVPSNWYNMTKWDKIDHMNNFGTVDKKDLVERDRVCKYELWEIALQKKDVMDTFSLRLVKQAMDKVKGWIKEENYVRFGTSYPRHKGSYRPEMSLESLL